MLNITRRQLFKQRQAGTFGNLSKRLYATIYDTPDEAVADIPHGSTIAMGGFACVGVPENLITALGKKGSMDLT